MTYLHCVDAAADQTMVPSTSIHAIQVTDANTVKIWLKDRAIEQTADVRLDAVVLTATATAADVAAELIAMIPEKAGRVIKIIASGGAFPGVSTVAFTVGA